MTNAPRGESRPRFCAGFASAFILVAAGLGAVPAAASDAADPTIVFSIQVPETTPEDAEIWLSGNRPELGAWNGRGLRADRTAPQRYEVSQTFPLGTVFQFKVTRGSWDTVEKGPGGEEIGNRGFRVDGPETARIVVANWRDQVDGGVHPSTVTGDVRVHADVTSEFVTPRDVLVYLPPGYESHPELHYPVLYMHDGQNLFDRATSFLGIEWEVDETVERLVAAGEIDSLIVVGVYNSGSGRIYDYTPVPNHPAVDGRRLPPEGGNRSDGGGADDYGRFLVRELKPLIDRTYRTLPGRESTGIVGSSLGGLVSLYLGLELDDSFGRIGVVSPSVGWADGYILEFVERTGHRDVRIWLDMGTAESSGAVGQARALRETLTAAGWVLGEDLEYMEISGAPHDESAWAERTDDILRFLYPTKP